MDVRQRLGALLLGAIVMLLPALAWAQCATCGVKESGACCCPCPPFWAHRSSAFGEFLYLHPSGADLAHAQQQNGLGGAGTTPFGTVGQLDPTGEPSFRLGFSIALNQCSSVAAAYTHFESNAISTLNPPAIANGAVGSLVHHPGAALTASVGPVDAAYGIDFQFADIDYRRLLVGDDQMSINYSLGIRYASLDQDLFQTGNFGGGLGGVIETTSNSSFEAVGPRIGVSGEHRLGNTPFSVYGGTAGALLTGQFRNNYVMQNVTTANTLAQVQWRDDRIVPFWEYDLGVAWTSQTGEWRVASGVRTMVWSDVVTTPVFVEGVRQGNLVDLGDRLAFDGLSLRVERRW